VIGNVRIAVLLTACSDVAARPAPGGGLTFNDLFTRPSPQGDCPFDFYTKGSYGALNLSGSFVFPWVTGIDENGASLTSMKLKSYPGGGDPARFQRILAGIRGAQRAGINLDPFDVFVVVPNFAVDSFGGQAFVAEMGRNVGYAFLDSGGWFTGNACHELGHALGLEHSYGPYGDPENPPTGEYGDPFDIMSANHCFSFTGSNGGTEPGLCAGNLVLEGWIPQGRTQYIGEEPITDDRLVTLAALSHPEANGILALIIVSPGWPYNGSDSWTVEFRRQDGFDASLPRDVVLVHHLPFGSSNVHVVPIVTGNPTGGGIERAKSQGMTPGSGKWVAPGGLEIVVESFDLVANTATLRLTASSANVSDDGVQRVVASKEVGRGVYHYPGGPLDIRPGQPCAQRDYCYVDLEVAQEVVVTATRNGIPAARPLLWMVNDQPVAIGATQLVLQIQYPKASVTLDCTLVGDTLTLRNRPGDGGYRIWVDCFPADPVEYDKGGWELIYDFEPKVRQFEPDYYTNMQKCADLVRARIAEILGRLRTIPQALPHGGDPLAQISVGIQRQLRALPGMDQVSVETVRQLGEFGEPAGPSEAG
jgi:hypothetical protein